MGRTDVINVAGHRLSTGVMEEVLSSHPDVAECAVIGVADSLKEVAIVPGLPRHARERSCARPCAASRMASTIDDPKIFDVLRPFLSNVGWRPFYRRMCGRHQMRCRMRLHHRAD
ncbi:AMP-binding enzyme [Spirillospora sp. CA-255316]